MLDAGHLFAFSQSKQEEKNWKEGSIVKNRCDGEERGEKPEK